MIKYISIGKVAEEFAVSAQTIRNWEKLGMFSEVKRTK
jgi:DNA-binding transcriptional MerR regulator